MRTMMKRMIRLNHNRGMGENVFKHYYKSITFIEAIVCNSFSLETSLSWSFNKKKPALKIPGNKLCQLYGAEGKVVQDSVDKQDPQRIQNKQKNVLLRMVYAQVSGNHCIMSKWKNVQRAAQNTLSFFFPFLTHSPFLLKRPHTCSCFAKEKQTSFIRCVFQWSNWKAWNMHNKKA